MSLFFVDFETVFHLIKKKRTVSLKLKTCHSIINVKISNSQILDKFRENLSENRIGSIISKLRLCRQFLN